MKDPTRLVDDPGDPLGALFRAAIDERPAVARVHDMRRALGLKDARASRNRLNQIARAVFVVLCLASIGALFASAATARWLEPAGPSSR